MLWARDAFRIKERIPSLTDGIPFWCLVLAEKPGVPGGRLHLEGNQPLNWYGHCLAKFLHYDLGEYEGGKRPVHNCPSWDTPTWLSDKQADPNELENLAADRPDQVVRLQERLREVLGSLGAPPEQAERLGLG